MILGAPIKTEKAVGKIEFDNTVMFEIADIRATKKQIKEEVEKRFGVKVATVNTFITPKGKKHAAVRLAQGFKAETITTKLKIA